MTIARDCVSKGVGRCDDEERAFALQSERAFIWL